MDGLLDHEMTSSPLPSTSLYDEGSAYKTKCGFLGGDRLKSIN